MGSKNHHLKDYDYWLLCSYRSTRSLREYPIFFSLGVNECEVVIECPTTAQALFAGTLILAYSRRYLREQLLCPRRSSHRHYMIFARHKLDYMHHDLK